MKKGLIILAAMGLLLSCNSKRESKDIEWQAWKIEGLKN